MKASKLGMVCVLGASTIAFVGCASSTPESVPSSARMLDESRGDITATAPHDGTFYVYDKTDSDLVYSGKVNRDDVIRLHEDSGNIDINGRKVAEKALVDHHDREVFFDPMSRAEAASYSDSDHETTVVKHGDKTTVVTPSDSDSTVITH